MKTLIYLRQVLSVALFLLAFQSYAQSNYFAGSGAGASNTTGNDNTFVGGLAGNKNTSGFGNSFFGSSAGQKNATGIRNSFFGTSSGFNSLSNDNTYMGYAAGFTNTTGSSNTAMGSLAGVFNTTGSYNCFFGHQSGNQNSTGSSNSFFGQRSGEENTTGGFNSFVGYCSGLYNREGWLNSFVGSFAGYSNVSGSYNSFLGYGAGVYNSNGSYNTAVGMYAGVGNSFGSENTYLGSYSSSPNGTPISLTNATAIGTRAYVSTSNALVLGSIAGINGASANVSVGIGLSAPSYQLHLSTDNAAKAGSSTWTIASDKRLKTNIQDFSDGLQVLQQIRPVRYHYNGKAQTPTDKEFIGILAQEMKEIAPYMIGEFTYRDTTGKEEKYLDYDASALTYVLVNSVKELGKENEALKRQLSSMEERMAKLEQRMGGNPNSSVARLWQNAPNPYDRNTVIRYVVPTTASKANIQLFDSNGRQVGDYPLPVIGEGEITLSANHLSAGTYIYKLIVDGVSADSKKLVLVK